MKRAVKMLCLCVATVLNAHAAVLEFSGYLKSDQNVRFVLTDTEAQKSSGFLAIGDSFAGHKVVAFDAKTESLIVAKDAAELRLSLKNAKVRDGAGNATDPNVFRVGTTTEGKLILNGRPISFDEFDMMLQNHGRTREPLTIELQEPSSPNHKSFEAANNIVNALKASGIRGWKLKVVHDRDSTK